MRSLFGLVFGVAFLAVSVSREAVAGEGRRERGREEERGEGGEKEKDHLLRDLNETFFISEIFEKYGNNNIMTYEGFEHLLENLGLGKLKFETKHDVSIHKINGTFREFHDELFLHRHEHDVDSRENEKENTGNGREKRNIKTEEKVERSPMRKCLTVQDILKTYGLKPYHEVVISPSKYLEICPAIVYELDQKLCLEEEPHDNGHDQAERHLVWIYASVSVSVMGICGMLCVLVVPLVSKDHSSGFMVFLVSLAVGTLCGDALIHLIPQIFSTDGRPDSNVIVVLRGTVVLAAIYVFFIIENVLKGIQTEKKKTVEGEEEEEEKELGKMLEKEGHCHHGEIKTVAWIAIMGDILHNVTDGLSIGAAFRTSLSSGFASSLAIFCHELPHELGDYAILLASGMSVRKALFYNVVSTVFSLLGMVAGVLLGEVEDASLWINAFTAGSFLYIALSDLVPEMTTSPGKRSLSKFLVQATGLMSGGTLMFIVALYEDQIESFLCL